MGIIISRHARERLRKRVGIQKKNIQTHMRKVIKEGRRVNDFKGKLHRYLLAMALKTEEYHHILLYNNYLYFFGKDTALITVFIVEQRMRRWIK